MKDSNTDKRLKWKTNLYFAAILVATLHKEGIEKES